MKNCEWECVLACVSVSVCVHVGCRYLLRRSDHFARKKGKQERREGAGNTREHLTSRPKRSSAPSLGGRVPSVCRSFLCYFSCGACVSHGGAVTTVYSHVRHRETGRRRPLHNMVLLTLPQTDRAELWSETASPGRGTSPVTMCPCPPRNPRAP